MSDNLKQNVEALFGKMDSIISSKTVVGEAVTFGDVVIVPLIDVSFGFVVGGTSKIEKRGIEGSGGGMGTKITPSAVLVVSNGTVQLVNVKNQDSLNKLIDMVPGILSKLNFSFGKGKKEESTDAEENINKKSDQTIVEDIIITE